LRTDYPGHRRELWEPIDQPRMSADNYSEQVELSNKESPEECPAGPNWCIELEKGGSHTPCRQAKEVRKRWLKHLHLQSEAAKGLYLMNTASSHKESPDFPKEEHNSQC